MGQNETSPTVGDVRWFEGIKYRWNGWVWVRVGWEREIGW